MARFFPKGRWHSPDGSVLAWSRSPAGPHALSGRTAAGEIVAETGGGPNGAAMGPDGRIYVCNNGGFDFHVDPTGRLLHRGRPAGRLCRRRIQRVDLKTGAVETLYTECDGNPLKGPNDLVFDRSGGFWFTDLGKAARAGHRPRRRLLCRARQREDQGGGLPPRR